MIKLPWINKNVDEDGNRVVVSKKEQLEKEFESDRKRQEFLSKFKMGKHNTVERQLISMAIFTGFIAVGGGISFHKWTVKENETLSDTALYTTEVAFSKDDKIEGEVTQIYRSEDGKTGYVILKFPDTSLISTNAKNYKVFVSAVKQRLQGKITGDMLVFGESGYIGVRVYHPQGLPNQIWDFTIRMDKSIRNEDDARAVDDLDDSYGESFKKFNQIRIYANLGAKKAAKVPNGIDNDPEALYREFVGNELDKGLRDSVAKQTKSLRSALVQIEEYNQRLNNLGYESIPLPEILKGISFDEKTGELDSLYTVPGGFNIPPRARLDNGGYLKYFINGAIDEESIQNVYVAKALEVNPERESQIGKADLSKVKGLVSMPYEGDYKIDEILTVNTITPIGGDKPLDVTNVNSNVATESQMNAAKVAQEISQLFNESYRMLSGIQTQENVARVALQQRVMIDSNAVTQASGEGHFIQWQQRSR